MKSQCNFECNESKTATQTVKDSEIHNEKHQEGWCETTEYKNVFLSHHEEEVNEEDFEFNETLWNVLFSDDEKTKLTETEKKEIIKLHKYFAHRSGQKLWENLFHPAGILKGKKKLVLEFLEQCEICRKYKRTPSRPKVGLPKAKDVNEVVSLDLKILKKKGNKEIGILYLHDEFSKLTKGHVINDKNRDTIVKGIESKWIIGGGAGPGHPSKGFFSNN